MLRSAATITALALIPSVEGSPNSQIRKATMDEVSYYENEYRNVRNIFGACKLQFDSTLESEVEALFQNYGCNMDPLSDRDLVHEFVPSPMEPFFLNTATFPFDNKVNRRLEAELNVFITEYAGGYPGPGGYPVNANPAWAYFSGSVWKTHTRFGCSVCSVESSGNPSSKVVTICRFNTPFNQPGEFDQVGGLFQTCDACVGHSCTQPPAGGCTVSNCQTVDDEPQCVEENWQQGGGSPRTCDDGVPGTQATCVDGTGECRTSSCVPEPVVKVNGLPVSGVAVSGAGSLSVASAAELVLPLRDFLDSTSYHEIGSRVNADVIKVECPACNTAGCRFYIFSYHCPPFSTGLNGGLQSLLSQEWEVRSCGPNFLTAANQEMQPTLIYRKDIAAGQFEEVVIEGQAPFVGVFSETQQPGNDGWCSGQQAAVGPFQKKVCKPIN
eukprot:TRINITY_DN338_c0_g2_i1.p1 TRINITY_DN338_c0_g2~~TRINITY_DN338_c0_g2_i1.p1  ORF type:complete len:440 (+),score=91.42 TRINITY_DN338_c0_g2_i1:58-1377(+)